jgi:hypothetical protein
VTATTREHDGVMPSEEEIVAVARGIAGAVAPASGLTDVQAALLRALTRAVTGADVDYGALTPLPADALAALLHERPHEYRHRIVHHMVLGELVLTPLPTDVAARVAEYSGALGVDDGFVRMARHYATGALGLALVDLHRNGFLAHWDEADSVPLHAKAALADPFDDCADPELAARWEAFGALAPGSLGRSVHDMYRSRGFLLPGTIGAASPYLAQHDFIHVIADYGSTLEGELEVFALVGRADPDPKGFVWLATMIGLFETGYVHKQGPFEMDVREHHLRTPGMDVRLADALRRGKCVAERFGRDLLEVDYHALVDRSVDEMRDLLSLPPKSDEARAARSPGVFDPDGMSEFQREAGRLHVNP